MSNSSIWPIDRTLSRATTMELSDSENDGKEGVLWIHQSSSIPGASTSKCLVSYPGHSFVGILPTNECPGYDTKQFDVEAPGMLELWGIQSTPSLPSFSESLHIYAVSVFVSPRGMRQLYLSSLISFIGVVHYNFGNLTKAWLRKFTVCNWIKCQFGKAKGDQQFCFMTMLGYMLPGRYYRSSLTWHIRFCHIHQILLIFHLSDFQAYRHFLSQKAFHP